MLCHFMMIFRLANREGVSGLPRDALPQKSGRDLTPKVLANFSPGFPTPGNNAVKVLLTLKELRNRMELFQS